MPDQTLNFGVGNMIDMRKSRHSGKKIYYFLGETPRGAHLGDKGGFGGQGGDFLEIF